MAAFSRSLRRQNPRTLILGVLLAVAFVWLILSPSTPSINPLAYQSKHNTPAAHPLSPATAPFRKAPGGDISKFGPPPVVHYHMNNVTTTSDPMGNEENILILTPLARFYDGYWENLLALSYPHHLISVAFITPKTREGNTATQKLQAAIHKTQTGPEKQRFASVTILRQDFETPVGQNEAERHKMSNQKARRAAMSRARNSLLFTTLGPSTSWVLWMDADVVETPPTLIQDLAAHDKPVIVPNCMQRFINDKGEKDLRPYDYNTWVDSQVARDLGKTLGADDIILEGYAEMSTYRTLMSMIADKATNRDTKKIMEVDGVGGTALMVKAEVHRDGAMFPPFSFYHLIETEGFAKMSQRLGHKCFGLPNYFVYHYNE